MTANAMQGDREACIAAGMDDYISKPMHVDELVRALERAAAGPPPQVVPAASPPEPTVVLNRGVLNRLCEEIGDDDPTILLDVIDLFLADAPQHLSEMRIGLTNDAGPLVQRAAHTLKGSSASVGAAHLTSQCARLEALARDGQLDAGREQLRQVEAAYVDAERALRMLHAELAAPPTIQE